MNIWRYLSPLDEINRYSTQNTSSTASKVPSSGTGSGGSPGGLAGAVGSVDYGKVAEGETALDKISKSAEKLAKLLKKLWKPFQDAWKKEGKNTISAAQIALSGIAKLAKSVGRSLVEVWTNGTGTTMLTTMLRIAQNVLKTIGNIASGFADAWNKNNVGTQIIQNIANALVVVMQFIERIAADTATWAANLDFYVINTADEAEKNTGGAEDNAESTGEEVQDTAASVESDSADQTSEDAETAADIQNDQTIDTEGIYD